jgi:hypothetical protein
MSERGWLERDLVGDTSGHECATHLWIVRAARNTVRDPRAAVLAVLAVTGACLGGIPALALALPLTYLLRFTLALLDGRARQATRREAGVLPIELPSPLSFSDEGARGLIDRLERSRCAIENAILAGPAGAPFALSGLIDEVPQLERDVVILAARIEYLGRFLSSAPSPGLLEETARLGQDRDKETDPAVRHAFERLIARCREHLDTLKLLDARRSASFRRAEEVMRALEEIPAKIVSLQLSRVESLDVRGDSVLRAESVTEGFAALEGSLSPSSSSGLPSPWSE